MYRDKSIAVVIPAYNEEGFIGQVIREIPSCIDKIVVVNDCSTDSTPEEVRSQQDPRTILLHTPCNQGVGGATVLGFQKALELGSDIVVKIDGDHQMPAAFVPSLLDPLVEGRGDYAKGNRFCDFKSLRQMPFIRRIGNIFLSFAAKLATGYWHCFDITNGFFAIRKEAMERLSLEHLDHSYYFEHSLLGELYLIDAVVVDVPMPARYGSEISHLSIFEVLRKFPFKLIRTFLRRIVIKKFIYDFSMQSLYLLVAISMLTTGLLYGGGNWIYYARLRTGAPTGTVVISAMLITLGFQILLAFIQMDMDSVPKEPLHKKLLPMKNNLNEHPRK